MILDLHNHTRWSFDCSMDPAKVVRVAKARGIDAIAITDHDEIDGAREAQRAAGGDILVIIGEEIDTRAGDVLGLFLKEKIATDDPIEAIRAIHDQGGLAILAHPFTKTKSVDDRVDPPRLRQAHHLRGIHRAVEGPAGVVVQVEDHAFSTATWGRFR